MSRTRKLDPVEIRVLGALLEKEQTTPEQYPLTTLAVVAACNQKTNREPVTDLSETEVTEALDRLREDVLVWRTQTARAERWEHRLDRRWELDKRAKAVMTLLLLRGPQTPGELRTRAERLHPFESVEEVEETLQRLASGFDALVRELPRRPGQREARWTHREGVDEAQDGRATGGEEERPRTPARAPETPIAEARGTEAPTGRRPPAEERLERLEREVGELRETVEALREQLRQLRAELGVE
ncbi:MAG TPA: YceH family protein [Thermoanaerobaculia bacterium]